MNLHIFIVPSVVSKNRMVCRQTQCTKRLQCFLIVNALKLRNLLYTQRLIVSDKHIAGIAAHKTPAQSFCFIIHNKVLESSLRIDPAFAQMPSGIVKPIVTVAVFEFVKSPAFICRKIDQLTVLRRQLGICHLVLTQKVGVECYAAYRYRGRVLRLLRGSFRLLRRSAVRRCFGLRRNLERHGVAPESGLGLCIRDRSGAFRSRL